MRKFKYGRLFCVCLAAMSFCCCGPVAEEGVSFSLASRRSGLLSNVHYSLGFDQPDLKAVFKLTLNVPKSWIAVSNTEVFHKEDLGNSIQSERITNPDRKESFEMLCRAASPDPNVRKALFESFLESDRNRRPESRVLSALALLCHRNRQEEALSYIVPSLDALEEIQRTGDIFFPGNWCSVLLKNQPNDAAKEVVDGWLSSHPEINPLLATKILQASCWIRSED